MKNILLTIASFFALSGATAQISIAPVGGIDVIGQSIGTGGSSYSTDLRVGPCAGILVDLPLKGILSPQLGLIYKLFTSNYRGTRTTYGGPDPVEDYRAIVTTLEVPAKLIYSFPSHKGNRFFVGAGPYVGINVSASAHVHGHYYDASGNEVKSYERVENFRSNSIDIGGGISGGFRAANGLLICLQGQYSFANSSYGPYQERVYNFGVLGGYTFKLKKHKAPPEPAQSK